MDIVTYSNQYIEKLKAELLRATADELSWCTKIEKLEAEVAEARERLLTAEDHLQSANATAAHVALHREGLQRDIQIAQAARALIDGFLNQQAPSKSDPETAKKTKVHVTKRTRYWTSGPLSKVEFVRAPLYAVYEMTQRLHFRLNASDHATYFFKVSDLTVEGLAESYAEEYHRALIRAGILVPVPEAKGEYQLRNITQSDVHVALETMAKRKDFQKSAQICKARLANRTKAAFQATLAGLPPVIA